MARKKADAADERPKPTTQTRRLKKRLEGTNLGTPPERDVDAWVHYARRGYDEGYQAAREAGKDELVCESVGKQTWRQCLPILSSREMVRPYVACVAHGLQLSVLTAEEARVLMYAAQMALAAQGKAAS